MASYDFIFGDTGSGVSRYVCEWLDREARRSPYGRFFLFVPEQNTLKVQREIAELSPSHGMLSLDVLSFRLLFHRVTEELGITDIHILDETKKKLLLRKAALDASKAGELRLYQKKIDSRGFISELENLIGEFCRYSVTEEALSRAVEAVDGPVLKEKLSDVLSIYSRFLRLKGNETSGEEAPSALLRYIERSSVLKDATIVFDGFTGFTPSELELLKHMLPMAGRVRFAFDLPEDVYPYAFRKDELHDIWWLTKRSVALVTDIASAAGVRIGDPPHIYPAPSGRARAEKKTYIFEAPDPTSEIRFVARNILNDALFGDMRFKHIAVVVSAAETYREIIKREFASYSIPFFMDEQLSPGSSPFVSLLLSAFGILKDGWVHSGLMRFLKNPLVTMDEGAKSTVDELDNILRKSGLKGRSGIRGLSEYMEPGSVSMWIEALSDLEDSIRARDTVGEMIDETLLFAERTGLSERDLRFSEYLSEKGFIKESAEEQRFTELSAELFEKTKEIFAFEKTSPGDYFRLMEAGLSDLKGGIIPETMDMVMVGDLRRSRMDDIDSLYIVGANDSLIPSAVTGGGILNDFERIELEKAAAMLPEGESFELAPDDRVDTSIQNFYLHSMMKKPEKKLSITYSRTARDGAKLRPSAFLKDICAENHDFHIPENLPPVSIEDGLAKLSGFVRGGSIHSPEEIFRFEALLRAVSSDPSHAGRVHMILLSARPVPMSRRLDIETARALYGESLHASVSSLESFASCPYAYFLRYGLKLREREAYSVESLDMGNLYHSALDTAFKNLPDGRSLRDLPDRELDGLAGAAADQAAAGYRDSILSESARNLFLKSHLEKSIRRTLRAVRSQQLEGSFETEGTEVEFRNISPQTVLQGTVDRIDIATDPDSGDIYVNVIDYKSSAKALDMALALEGLNMQLVVYMEAALESLRALKKGRRILPGGLFYQQVHDPELSFDGRADSDIEKQRLLLARLRGVASGDEKYMRLLDRKEDTAAKESLVFDSKNTVFLDSAKILSLIEGVRKTRESLSEKILSGSIDAAPYKDGAQTGCRFCGYRNICGFDRVSFRRIRRRNPAEEGSLDAVD